MLWRKSWFHTSSLVSFSLFYSPSLPVFNVFHLFKVKKSMISQKQGHTSGAFKGPQTFHKALAIKESHNCPEILHIFPLKERVKWLDPTKSCVIQIAISLFLRERVWHLKVFIVLAHTILFSSFPLCWWLFRLWAKLDDMQTVQCNFCLF